MDDIAYLVKKRLELKISLREVQKHIGFLSKEKISLLERRKKTLPQRQILALKQFYNDCEAGRINYQRSENVCSSSQYIPITPRRQRQKKQEISSQKINEMREIRKKLNLSQYDVADAVGISQMSVSDKERQKMPLRKNEYEKIMNFFKQEKLRQIFGEKKK